MEGGKKTVDTEDGSGRDVSCRLAGKKKGYVRKKNKLIVRNSYSNAEDAR